jgi:hypothetical protein
MDYHRNNGGHAPFFITLVVNNLLLHNCMLDYGASTNVMSLKVMNELGLETTRPYRMYVGLIQKQSRYVA